MATELEHASDQQLRALIFGDDRSAAYQATAVHVEACQTCRARLDAAAGSEDIDVETRNLLSDYPWDDLSKSRIGAGIGDSTRGQPETLDFLAPPSHPEMLGRLGRYEIERVIGSGGMGIVLKAFDTELNRPVAIKVLARHLSHAGAARKRFAREAKAAAAVVHEHVVAIYNVEAERDVPFLVMQYVAGQSLQTRVDRDGPLGVKEILRVGIQAAMGLAAAHEQGVIHRDIKPANILAEEGVERVLLTDFGLARTVDDASLTHTGVVAGTPHYMSPEQASGEAIDHRTDLFSLGSVLYFMATGHPPFRAERAMGVLHRICSDRHRPAWQVNGDIPDELSKIIDRLLAKRPARRYSSALEAKESMTKLLSRIQHRGIRSRSRVALLVRRYPVGLFSAACGALLVVAAATFLLRPQLVGRAPSGDIEPAASPAVSIQMDHLVVETEALSAASHDMAGRLEQLETTTNTARFETSGDPFWADIGRFDERLKQLESDPFRGNDNYPPQGE